MTVAASSATGTHTFRPERPEAPVDDPRLAPGIAAPAAVLDYRRPG
ncbi:MAG TPA: hypothetical protein VMT87_10090 [Vicinamibacteria bacterium]|nr:hypothetical protein [Vicinamibacteria bacterium]